MFMVASTHPQRKQEGIKSRRQHGENNGKRFFIHGA
jgi:hypothetical protein